jgi:branched-chain amino acid transport system substrate-binding protein
MATRKFGVGVAAIATLALSVACSSSGGDSGSGETSAAAGGSGAKLSGSPVKIMVTGTLNGPGIGYPEAADGAKAAAEAINAAGGIDGHPVKIEVCDDHYDANEAASCAQKAVNDKVTALVGAVNFFSDQTLSTIEKAKIPWVASTVVTPGLFKSAMSFPVDGGGVVPQTAMGREAVQLGGKNVVVVSIDHANALQNAVPIKNGAELAGGKVTDIVKYPPGTVDFSSTAASVVSKKPDAVVCLCSSQNDWSSLFKSLTQAGYKGPFSTSVTFITKDILKTLGESANQVFMVDGQRPFDSPNPAMKQYQSEITKYASGDAVRNQIMGDGWLGVHVVADALTGASATDAASLLEALTSKSKFPSYGLVDKITFSGEAPVSAYPRFFNVAQIAMKYDPSAGKVVTTTDEFFEPFAAGE